MREGAAGGLCGDGEASSQNEPTNRKISAAPYSVALALSSGFQFPCNRRLLYKLRELQPMDLSGMSYEIAPFCILVVSGIGVGAILGEIFQLATTPKSSKVSGQQ